MRIIGLTGNIGSGKSLIAAFLKELGAGIVNGDIISRRVAEPGSPALEEIIAAFGSEYLRPDGTLDRKKLGERVFSNPEDLALLNRITHPRIKEGIRQELALLEKQGKEAAVVEAAVLFEGGFSALADIIWLAEAPREDIYQRLALRDGLNQEEAELRLANQLPPEKLREKADIIIRNDADTESLYQQVRAAYAKSLGRGEKELP